MTEFFASQRLSAYIDGELSAAEMAEVERALRENAELRAEYERLSATVDFLREHGPVRAPSGFHDRVMASVEHEPAPGGLLARIRGWFAAMPVETFAVALAAVLVAVVVSQKLDDPSETAPTTGEELADRSRSEDKGAVPAPGNADGDLGSAVSTEDQDAVQSTKGNTKEAPAWAEEMAGVLLPDDQPQKRVSSIVEPSSEDGVVTLEVDDEPAPELSAATKDMPDTEIDDGSTNQQLQAAASYRLRVDDPQDLRSLLMLIERYDGTATSNGKAVDEDALVEGASRVGVSILIPQGNLPAFHKALKQLGPVDMTSQNSAAPLYGSDSAVKVFVDVTQ